MGETPSPDMASFVYGTVLVSSSLRGNLVVFSRKDGERRERGEGKRKFAFIIIYQQTSIYLGRDLRTIWISPLRCFLEILSVSTTLAVTGAARR